MTDSDLFAHCTGAFAGKVCVVTGAGSGIGRALALNLASQGARLAISDIDSRAAAATAAWVHERGAEVEHYVLDVADRDAVYAHAEQVKARFGNANLVVNNAGVALEGAVSELRYDDFEWIMGINFWGVVHGSKAFLPQLIASGDGNLINISSVFGLIAVPTQGSYNAAKFAVRGFTEALSQELAISGAPVRVSCVHPGGVKTNIARSARSATARADGAGNFGDREQAAAAFDKIALTGPDKAARIILKGAAKGKARILVGPDAYALHLIAQTFGSHYQQLLIGGARFAQKFAH